MAAIRIKGFVYAERVPSWLAKGEDRYTVHVLPNKSTAEVWGVCVGEIDVPYELPVGFDMKAETIRQEIARLEERRAEAARKFAEEVRTIDERLAKLQAIEYTPADGVTA